jgi:hypothetical protein
MNVRLRRDMDTCILPYRLVLSYYHIPKAVLIWLTTRQYVLVMRQSNDNRDNQPE